MTSTRTTTYQGQNSWPDHSFVFQKPVMFLKKIVLIFFKNWRRVMILKNVNLRIRCNIRPCQMHFLWVFVSFFVKSISRKCREIDFTKKWNFPINYKRHTLLAFLEQTKRSEPLLTLPFGPIKSSFIWSHFRFYKYKPR